MSNGAQPGVVHLVKTLLTIVGATVAIGATAVAVVAYFLSMEPRAVAEKEHEAIKTEFRSADGVIIDHARAAEEQIRDVGRDVKTVKCILQAPTMKAKARCGLE